jgi:hypothetical protein
VGANVICPDFVRTPSLDTERAKELGVSEQEVVKHVMLKETVDCEFTTVADVAQTSLFLATFHSNALTGRSVVVSHGGSCSRRRCIYIDAKTESALEAATASLQRAETSTRCARLSPAGPRTPTSPAIASAVDEMPFGVVLQRGCG